MLADAEVERILVVTAHPDDVDFGAAGSVARWTDAGAHVAYCIVTDGDAGGFDPDVPRGDIAGIRRREQTEAAAQVGVEELHFLGYPDGRLEITMDVRRDISRVIRQVRPRRVVTQSPVRTFDSVFRSHPDHLAAGEAACCAVYPDSRNPFTFTELVAEGLEAWTVEELWIMGTAPGAQESFVDITDTFDRKIKALLRHESQMTDPGGMEQRLRDWNEANAVAGGLGAGRLAERFAVMPTV
ncbi:MAG: PIG-L deacetylase family protein [Acidimicrobiia bacterium]